MEVCDFGLISYSPVVKERALRVFGVIGSLNRGSATRAVLRFTVQKFRKRGVEVDLLDLMDEPLALFNPDSSRQAEGFLKLKERVERADVYLLGTPDYHGSISSALKNFLDHFWHEFAGKLFVTIVASHEKGLTVTDQLRTVARQCYAWTLPYGISFSAEQEVIDCRISSPALKKKLEMLVQDVKVYGRLLAQQRDRDLAGSRPGFLSKYRRGRND